MKVYKYRTVDAYSLAGLANSELWFSGLQDFNDPFEGSYKFEKDEFDHQDKSFLNKHAPWQGFTGVAKKNIDAYIHKNEIKDFDSWSSADKWILVFKIDIESMLKTIHASKAVCLSRQYIDDNDFISGKEQDTIIDNLMWSHYSSGLRGYCLVFDFDQFYESLVANGDVVVVTPIEYQDHPSTLELKKWQEMIWAENPDEVEQVNYIYKTIATKSPHWKYEKEVRFVSTERSTSKRKYDPRSLVEIVLGEKMPEDQRKLVISTARSANPNIKIKVAKLKSGSYELEIVDFLED